MLSQMTAIPDHPAGTDSPQSGTADLPPVPLTRLDNADPGLMEELLAAVADVARRAAFTLGEEVEAFEADFASYCEVPHAVGVSSGTEALVLCLRAMGLGSGDEVIVPANSFVATAEAVTLVSATPRFADVDADTQLLTAAHVEAALGPRVRAVIPVHLYGRTVDMEPILELARGRDLRVIEDAAQAHGARYQRARVGSLADCACFSFYPSKNLGAWGDAGAVTTGDAGLADRVRLLRSHGERPRYEHLLPGTTARLDALQAAVLRIKLARLDAVNEARRQLAARLRAAIGPDPLPPPEPPPGQDHVYHQFVVRCDERDALRSHLDACGVASGVHYPTPIHRSPAYANPAGPRLPTAERLSQTVCSLPIYATMTDLEVARVIEACQTFASPTERTV